MNGSPGRGQRGQASIPVKTSVTNCAAAGELDHIGKGRTGLTDSGGWEALN